MRRSSFKKLGPDVESTDINLSRDVSSQYDNVKIVADNMTAVVAAGENISTIVDVYEQVVPNLTEILLTNDNAAIAGIKALEATDVALLASKWASNPEDVIVAGGEYSAYHWAQKAEEAVAPSNLLAAIKTVDGAGSELDADLLDGQHGAYYTDANINTQVLQFALMGA